MRLQTEQISPFRRANRFGAKNRRLLMTSNHGQTFFSLIAAIIASTIGFAITLI